MGPVAHRLAGRNQVHFVIEDHERHIVPRLHLVEDELDGIFHVAQFVAAHGAAAIQHEAQVDGHLHVCNGARWLGLDQHIRQLTALVTGTFGLPSVHVS